MKHITELIATFAALAASFPAVKHELVALTISKLIELWGDKSDGPSNAEIVSFGRAVERAHGIGFDVPGHAA